KKSGPDHGQFAGTAGPDAARRELPRNGVEREGEPLCCRLTNSAWSTSWTIAARSKRPLPGTARSLLFLSGTAGRGRINGKRPYSEKSGGACLSYRPGGLGRIRTGR